VSIHKKGLSDIPAFTASDDITDLDTNEARGQVSSDVRVSLLITVVLLDVVKIFTADDHGSLHLGRDDGSAQDLTTDADITDEGALLVDVGSFDGLLRSLESKTDFLVPAVGLGLLNLRLCVKEDVWLLLESFFGLFQAERKGALARHAHDVWISLCIYLLSHV
jgi:hypothetical protein